MLRKFWMRRLWRHYRLQIWKKRLQLELNSTCARLSTGREVELKVSWGPFFNGAALLNRKATKASILIQIPYDFHLTENERYVMKTFHIPASYLPYFILNHEYFHLIDTLASLDKGIPVLDQLHVNQQLAASSSLYRELPFEQDADQFAYNCFREKIREAS